MEEIRRVAFESVMRACGFGSLAIFCVMVGLSFDPKLAFLDCATPMLGADGKPRPELFKADGLHLNEEGYKLWSGLLRPLLDQPAPKSP